MLLSLALVFLCGIALGGIFKKLRLPPLLGMLLTGILLGPYVGNLLSGNLLAVSADLRKIALIIILTRAGLNLDVADLKKAGRPALLLCFLPACFEIGGMLLLGPMLLDISLLEAAILGSVVAAVSPAVVVPGMLGLMEKGYGKQKPIPQMLMAGASVDDVFVLVLFTAFTGLAAGEGVGMESFARIPVSILLGIGVGGLCGLLLTLLFQKIHLRDSIKVLLLLSISFLLVTLENYSVGIFAFSGLLAVMSLGVMLRHRRSVVAQRLSMKYAKLWVAAELLLFVLVGAAVNVGTVAAVGGAAVLLVLLVLLFRMAGVFVSLVKTGLSLREKVFCMVAYCPKATVQAAIGAVPLSMGLPCGEIVLAVAVLSILITAPLGAVGIELLHKKCLSR